MFSKLLHRLQIASLILLVVVLSFDLSGRFLFAETLYPVQTKTLVPELPLLVVQSKNPKSVIKNGSNPFIPARTELPTLPTITPSAVSTDEDTAARLDASKIKLSAFSDKPGAIPASELNHCKALIGNTIAALPSKLTASLDDLTLFFSNREPRGLSNSHVLELRCTNLADTEIVSVLVHELGHIVDLGYFHSLGETPSGFLDGQIVITADDPSAMFYSLSWAASKQQRFSAERKDFVSGYAMTDSFEDFAESFNFYVLHGTDFRALATESPVLQKKYDFLRDFVFDGREFESSRSVNPDQRVWDVTLLPFDLAEFFRRA